MRFTRLAGLGILLCLCGSFSWQVLAADRDDQDDDRERAGNAAFDFAFIGDMPYGSAAEVQFDRVINQINRDRQIKFVMHAGDIKAGSERCDDALILHRFDQYQTIRRPFIFTPGDNEWTDCHRVNNGGYYPLERLVFLRSTFFPNPGFTTGGRVRRVHSQGADPAFSEFVENVWFRDNRVLFATVHVVGSNNDLEPWSGIDPSDSVLNPRPDRIAEFEARQAAALAWLETVFAAAQHSQAVFLMIQANPNFELPAGHPQRTGFDEFLAKLEQLAGESGKPVVLAHGDNHVFFIDKPLGYLLFSRMQTFGSAQVHWVKVHVDPRSPGVFSFEQRVVVENLN